MFGREIGSEDRANCEGTKEAQGVTATRDPRAASARAGRRRAPIKKCRILYTVEPQSLGYLRILISLSI